MQSRPVRPSPGGRGGLRRLHSNLLRLYGLYTIPSVLIIFSLPTTRFMYYMHKRSLTHTHSHTRRGEGVFIHMSARCARMHDTWATAHAKQPAWNAHPLRLGSWSYIFYFLLGRGVVMADQRIAVALRFCCIYCQRLFIIIAFGKLVI